MEHRQPGAPGQTITIAILAMGGEGGGVLADWIVDLAEQEGFLAQSTSVPGVAQRTGATIYYIEIFPLADLPPGSPSPVLSLVPVPGQVDIVVASELMEAGRAIQRGLVTPDRTTLITSTHRVYSMTEKTAMDDGRVNSTQLFDIVQSQALRLVFADYAQLARASGSVISAALFGALAGGSQLPFQRQHYEAAIRRSGVSINSSLKAFALGFDSANEPGQSAAFKATTDIPTPGPDLAGLTDRIKQCSPPEVRETLVRGIMRLADYQDVAYAGEYLDHLDSIQSLDTSQGDGRFRLLGEAARSLALWMSYEDAVRVADLKIRRSRLGRIASDVGCGSAQLLEVDDFFHPRVEEIADVLPATLGSWLLSSRLAHRLVNGGRVVRTTSVSGFLQLYALAELRRWRRSSLRFGKEQQRMRSWLSSIKSMAPFDYELAIAICECQQLIKGYGDTHQRGSASYDSILGSIDRIRLHDKSAEILRDLIRRALVDEDGQALRRRLKEI